MEADGKMFDARLVLILCLEGQLTASTQIDMVNVINTPPPTINNTRARELSMKASPWIKLRQGIVTIQLGEQEVKFTTFIEELHEGSTELTAMNIVLLVHLSVLLSGIIKARNINSFNTYKHSYSFPFHIGRTKLMSSSATPKRAFCGRMPTTLFRRVASISQRAKG